MLNKKSSPRTPEKTYLCDNKQVANVGVNQSVENTGMDKVPRTTIPVSEKLHDAERTRWM